MMSNNLFPNNFRKYYKNLLLRPPTPFFTISLKPKTLLQYVNFEKTCVSPTKHLFYWLVYDLKTIIWKTRLGINAVYISMAAGRTLVVKNR